MKKLYYLSITYFSQVDTAILHLLSNSYEVTYGVIIPNKNSNFSKEELEEYCKKYNIKFVPFIASYRLRDIRQIFNSIKVILSIGRSAPDLIYTVSLDNPFLAIIYLFISKKKTVVGIHDVSFHSDTHFGKVLSICRKFIVNHFRFFLVYSENQKRIFLDKYSSKKVLFNISLPLSGTFQSAGKQPVKSKNDTQFLFFGNVLSYKGLDILIKAVNDLSKRYSSFKLIIAGRCDDWDSVYKPMLEGSHIIEARIGFVDNRDIRDLFNNAHYLVLPYKDATQSGPLVLAYNYNVPVIASNIDAFKDAVEPDVSGYLFERNSVADLVKVLEAAILQSEPDYNNLCGRQQKFVTAAHSEAEMVKKYENMFSNIFSHS